jgi:N-acyl homoserine lactone hydrolase
MKVRAIQTGWVRVKSAQVARGPYGLLSIFTDRNWTDWLPSYTWLIEHAEGLIVVDTGQGAHLLEHRSSLHPYVRWEVEFRIEPEEEIGPQLAALGIRPRDVKTVVLTHLHMDHDGGLKHFPNSEILVAADELKLAKGLLGMMRGYLPNRWPPWFDPAPLHLTPDVVGSFVASRPITTTGDVLAVATPGHTSHHVSVLAYEDDAVLLLAGDASYNQELMLSGQVDGVSPNARMSRATLEAIQEFASRQPTIYLPTHDPDAAMRLANRQTTQR